MFLSVDLFPTVLSASILIDKDILWIVNIFVNRLYTTVLTRYSSLSVCLANLLRRALYKVKDAVFGGLTFSIASYFFLLRALIFSVSFYLISVLWHIFFRHFPIFFSKPILARCLEKLLLHTLTSFIIMSNKGRLPASGICCYITLFTNVDFKSFFWSRNY